MDALLLDCDSRLTEERKSTVEIRPRYANLHEIMTEAFREYKKDVESRAFPSQEHTFTISEDVLDKLY